MTIRIGHDYDVHRLVEGRRLVLLGGLEIPHSHGLLGHSDADVVLRAVSDAILAGLTDDFGGRLKITRRLLRTIGRLLDEAGTPNSCTDRVHSDERTNGELRAVGSALDTPTDRRAFDINSERHALVTSAEFETDALGRERLRHLRDVLNSQDLD